MKVISHLILMATILFVLACNPENEFQSIDELYVQAYLHADKSLGEVHFQRIIPLDSAISDPPPEDLTPLITDPDGSVFVLSFSGEEGVYTHPDLKIEAGKTYTLSSTYKDKELRAEAFVPAKPKELEISTTSVRRTKIRDFTDLQNQVMPDPVDLSWEGEDGAFYFVEVRNVERNPDPINEIFEDRGIEFPGFRSEPSSDPFYAINSFRDLTHFGTHWVIIYRVNAEYVALYEDNNSGAGSLNEIRTNVQNGFGIFTGINSDTLVLEVLRI